MKWLRKGLRLSGKVLLLVLVGAFTVTVFFPGLFIKYLQSYANYKYLNPLGLRLSYGGFVGDLFSSLRFQEITVTSSEGSFTLHVEDAQMEIDFLRLLKRDLLFQEVSIGSLQLNLPSIDPLDENNGFDLNRLPRVSISNLNIENATVTQGNTAFWFRTAGDLDLTGNITLENARIGIFYPQLLDTLDLVADRFIFDGQLINISAGDMSYQESRAALNGRIQLIPTVNVDLYAISDQFQRPEIFPEWLDCQSIEGRLHGTLDSLICRFSLGLSAQNHPLDRAEVDFTISNRGIYLERGLFTKDTQQVVVDGDIDLDGNLSLGAMFVNARLSDFLPDIPEFILDGSAIIETKWQGSDTDSMLLTLALDQLSYRNYCLNDIHGGLKLDDQTWVTTDTSILRFADSDIQLWGSVDVDEEIMDIEVYLQSEVLEQLLDSLGLAPVKGRADGRLWASGFWDDPSITGAITLDSLEYQGLKIGRALVQFVLDEILSRPSGRLYASTGNLGIRELSIEGGEAEFIFREDTVFATKMRLYQGLEKIETHGYLALEDPLIAVFDTLAAWRNSELLTSEHLSIMLDGGKIKISPTVLSGAGGQVELSGEWIDADSYALFANSRDLELEGVLRFLGEPPWLRGKVDGEVSIYMEDSRLGLSGTLSAADGEFEQIPFSRVNTEFLLADNRLILSQFDWQQENGTLAATGELIYALDNTSFGGIGSLDSLNLRGELDQFQFHNLQSFMPWPYETYGHLSGPFTATGAADRPIYTADLSASDPRFDLFAGESLTGRLHYEDERLTFYDLDLQTASGRYRGGGSLPADLRPGVGRLDIIKDAPVDLAFNGNTTQLDFIIPYFPDIDSLTGEYEIELSLSGTFMDLIRNGNLIVRNGKVELFLMENPISGVEGEISLVDNLLTVERLEAHTPSSQRRRRDNSSVALTGTMDMTRFFDPAFDLQLTGEHAYFTKPLGEIEATGSPNFTIAGRDTVYFRGEFIPDPNQFFIRMDYTTSTSYVLKEPDEGTILVYDIHVPLYSGATVDINDVTAEVEGEVTVTKVGSGDWRYAGTIDVLSGDFTLNGYDFVLDEGTVTLDPSAFNPQFYIVATTQVYMPSYTGSPGQSEDMVDVTLVLTGTMDDPQISFNSSYGLYSESDLLQIFALGTNPQAGVDPAMTASMSLTNIILRRIEEETRLVSGLDRFQIQTTNPRTVLSDLEAVRIHVGKRLWSNVYVGVRADPTLSFNQYEVALRISRNMSLVGSVDENGLYEIKYRLKLRY